MPGTLKGKRFESIEAQNEFLANWERNWAAKRIHGTERPGTVVLPMEERVLKPSRETHHILHKAQAIGVQTCRLCELPLAIEGGAHSTSEKSLE